MERALSIALAGDPALLPALRAALEAQPMARLAETGASAGAGPEAVFVAAGADKRAALEALEQAGREHPGAELALAADPADADLFLAALRLGVREALDAQTLPRQLPGALARMAARRARAGEAPPTGRQGALHAFIGAKGGVGVTTVAVNAARELARPGPGGEPRESVLVDMNLPYGESPLFLGMTPGPCLADILASGGQLAPREVAACAQRHASGLWLLPLPAQLADAPAGLSPETLCDTLALLRARFDHVTVDLGIYIDDLTLRVMAQADGVHLVGVQSMACVRNIRRFLDYVRPQAEARLVVNRHMADCELAVEDMEKTLGLKCFQMIPNDYALTLDAINRGTPVTDLAPRSAVSRALVGLAGRMAGADTGAGGLAGLARRFLGRVSAGGRKQP